MKKHAEQEAHKETASTQDGTARTTSADEQTKAPQEGKTPDTAGDNPANSAEGSAKPAEEPGEASPQGDVNARIAELEKLNADLQDQYLRKAADFDNYRKRMIREKQEAIDFANANLLVELVQVLDDFDRAIGHAGELEQGSPAAGLAEGVTMIRNQLGTMLENKYGLTYYPAKGEPFDPNVHEAIGTLPSPDVTEPTVSEEFTKGYKLKERIVRLAKVMVLMPAEKES